MYMRPICKNQVKNEITPITPDIYRAYVSDLVYEAKHNYVTMSGRHFVQHVLPDRRTDNPSARPKPEGIIDGEIWTSKYVREPHMLVPVSCECSST